MSFLTWLWLSLGATWLLAPADALDELSRGTPEALLSLEQTASVVAIADPLTAPIRNIFGSPPAGAEARAVLSRAASRTADALERARSTIRALPTTERRASGIGGAVEAGATALTRALARPLMSSEREAEVGDAAAEAWREIEASVEVLRETRSRITGLAVRQLISLLVEAGLLIAAVTAVLALRAGVGGRTAVNPIALTLRTPRLRTMAMALEARLHPDRGPIGRFLRREGLSHALAFEVDRIVRAHPAWPGSLKGHDAKPGGLWRHALAVGHLMAAKADGHGTETRRAAAFLGTVHDLGKLITYWPTASGWTSHPAHPHDSLSARLVLQLGSFRSALPETTRRALLQALRDYHSPEVFAQNAPPLARELLAWLQDADREAIEAAAAAIPEEAP